MFFIFLVDTSTCTFACPDRHLFALLNTGLTVNDTVIGDPLLTVPINAPGFPSDLHLCYEIHGAANQYFNFISDECMPVNAHYVTAAGMFFLSISLT